MSEAWIVSDLGWGDSGKGTTVDFLCRAHEAKLVVRWNGGGQAGHRVVLDDGRAHVFSQLGSGTFVPGVRTHLNEAFLFDPLALAVEARRLDVPDALARLSIAAEARVVTPFHVAANHLREVARGDAAHGTCGCGIGETVADAIAHPDDVLRAGDLRADVEGLRGRLERVNERVVASLDEELRATKGDPRAAHSRTLLQFMRPPFTDEFVARMRSIGDAEIVDEIDLRCDVVMEGAQGVLLDQDVGWTPPHVTWSQCTTHAVHAWLDAQHFEGTRRSLGVMRTYATRHGAGPFPTEAHELRPLLPEPETFARWQGAFRVGWLDLERLRYAIAQSPTDALVVTHLDRLGAIPTRDGVPTDEEGWLRFVERELGKSVAIASSGPTARDKRTIPR